MGRVGDYYTQTLETDREEAIEEYPLEGDEVE